MDGLVHSLHLMDENLKYVHDLNPGRDKGFVWLGWWVMDEIFDDGFDWIADPENERFTYKLDMKTLATAFKAWPDLEVQESRHGYILGRSDLT